MPSGEAIDLAVAAESLGYRTVWVGELRTFDAFALASAIARATSAISVVVGPLPAATRSPAQLAMGCATVTDVGGRPAHLAIGASSPAIVSGWHGRPWGDVIAQSSEAVRAVRPILLGSDASGFRLGAPSPDSAVLLAAQGPRMRRLAAEVADGLVLNLVSPAQVASARTAVGPDQPIAAWVPLTESADEQARLAFLRPYLRAPGYRASLAELVPDAAAKDIPVRALADAVMATEDDGLPARLASYVAAGATSVALLPIASSPAKRLDLLAAGQTASSNGGGGRAA